MCRGHEITSPVLSEQFPHTASVPSPTNLSDQTTLPPLLSPCVAPRLHHLCKCSPRRPVPRLTTSPDSPRQPPPPSLLQTDFSRFLITSVAPITFTHVIQADPTRGYSLPLQPCRSSLPAHPDREFLKLTSPRSLVLSSAFTKTLPQIHTRVRAERLSPGTRPQGRRLPGPARGTHRAFS